MRRHFFNDADTGDARREEIISRIERALSEMSLSELEALSYDMFTKGYLDKKQP